MQISFRLDLTDERVRSVLNSPETWKRVSLPYCIECSGFIGVNVFQLYEHGRGIRHVHLYGLTSTGPFDINRKDPIYPGWSLTHIEPFEMKKGERLVTQGAYDSCSLTYSRMQIGGFPKHIQDVEYMKNAMTGKRMQFLASVSEEHELRSHCDALSGLGIADGGLFFYVDWAEGVVTSIFQRS